MTPQANEDLADMPLETDTANAIEVDLTSTPDPLAPSEVVEPASTSIAHTTPIASVAGSLKLRLTFLLQP